MIYVSSVKEAISRALGMFTEDEELQFVVARGRATAGGAMIEAQYGDLVLHRSEIGDGTIAHGCDIEKTKVAVLDKFNQSPGHPGQRRQMSDKDTYEGWAIVELFEHNMIAGLISEQSIGGASFVRVDVPDVGGSEGFTTFYASSATYAITPTTEELARVAAGKLAIRPILPWVVPVPDSRKALPPETFDEF